MLPYLRFLRLCVTMKPNWRRLLNAQWRDARVLLRESRAALVLFLVVILGGAALLRLFYTFPDTTEHPGFHLGNRLTGEA